MPERITDETKIKIEIMYEDGEGLSPAEIARRIPISYRSTYGLTRVRQRINPETGRPFESLSQYHEYLAKQRDNPKTGKQFASLSRYNDHLARQRINPETGRPFESLSQYQTYKVRQNINPETGRPFESLSQYQTYRAKQRAQKPKNQRFSELIKIRLRELGKKEAWLAREVGVKRQTIISYIKGKTAPRERVLAKLSLALGINEIR